MPNRDGYCKRCGTIGLIARDEYGREESPRADFTDDYRRALLVPVKCTNQDCGHRWTEVYIYDHDED